MSSAREVAPGLVRWTTWHEEWQEQVGSVAVETADGLVFVDPLDPPAELGTPDHVVDVLLGAGAKPRATVDPIRLCPERWLGKATHDELRASLRMLLERPVQRVLTSHGEPVLRSGERHLHAVLS
ncbi:MAG TPA: hypothetical protein VLK36_00090 [Gaiellaceae bacterium]|nr:hypothetical protein [Gaiellaceae bacterium]